MSRRRQTRGAEMIEGALVFMVFAVLVAGITELGVIGLAGNAVTFAAHRASRFASVRGGASGHATTTAEIRAVAVDYASPLSSSNLAVTVTWLPDNTPGNSVEVAVAYTIQPMLLPLSVRPLTVRSIARQRIVQ